MEGKAPREGGVLTPVRQELVVRRRGIPPREVDLLDHRCTSVRSTFVMSQAAAKVNDR
jgi:hypothetical protein